MKVAAAVEWPSVEVLWTNYTSSASSLSPWEAFVGRWWILLGIQGGVDAENLIYLPSYVVKIVATQIWDHKLGMATLLVYFWLVFGGLIQSNLLFT